MNPNFNRRQFIGLAVCVAVNTALPGCKKKEPEWTAAKDDKLKPLAFEISEGKATPLSGSGWKRCDDYIHLQLSGSSIPDRKIAKVKQKKGTLIVYVDNGKYRHEKGEIHVSPFSFASQVQVDIEAITIIDAFAIS